MKNLFLFSLAAILMLAGCSQDNVQTESIQTKEQQVLAHIDLLRAQFAKSGGMSQNQTTNSRATCNKVPVCHNGDYVVVNKNAVPAHLSHGDQLTCCDNACIDGAEILKNSGPFTFYYDTEANDCLGFITDGFDEVLVLGFDGGNYYVDASSNTYQGRVYYSISVVDNNGSCNNWEEMTTQEEYDCVVDYLRSYISANTCIPNLCDLEF